jgi:hypothetical protein
MPWSICDHCPAEEPGRCWSRRHRRACVLATTPEGAATVRRKSPVDCEPWPDPPPGWLTAPHPAVRAPGEARALVPVNEAIRRARLAKSCPHRSNVGCGCTQINCGLYGEKRSVSDCIACAVEREAAGATD